MDNLEKKISDKKLLAFARSDSSDQRSVLIELRVIGPTVSFSERSSTNRDRSYSSPARVATNVRAKQENKAAKQAVQIVLNKIIDQNSKWIPSAQIFVVKATPQQLRQIANLSDVAMIKENRNLTPN